MWVGTISTNICKVSNAAGKFSRYIKRLIYCLMCEKSFLLFTFSVFLEKILGLKNTEADLPQPPEGTSAHLSISPLPEFQQLFRH